MKAVEHFKVLSTFLQHLASHMYQLKLRAKPAPGTGRRRTVNVKGRDLSDSLNAESSGV